MKKMTSMLLALFLLMLVPSLAFADYAPEDRPNKSGILVVSFGTSMPEARRAIDTLVDAAKKAYPEMDVRLAFTSNIIRRKLAREQNENILNPVEALARMNDDGFTHVYVMPTHMIPGEEYDEMKSVVHAFAGLVRGKYGFKRIRIGKPFMYGVPSCDLMARILVTRFQKQLKNRNTGIVLMGHGTPHHASNSMYLQLQLALDKVAYGRFFVGTVESDPLINDVIRTLKRHPRIKKLVISPLMIVAGDHANNDMADPEDPESWLNILKKAGYKQVTPHLVGMGEDPQMVKLFVERIRETIERKSLYYKYWIEDSAN